MFLKDKAQKHLIIGFYTKTFLWFQLWYKVFSKSKWTKCVALHSHMNFFFFQDIIRKLHTFVRTASLSAAVFSSMNQLCVSVFPFAALWHTVRAECAADLWLGVTAKACGHRTNLKIPMHATQIVNKGLAFNKTLKTFHFTNNAPRTLLTLITAAEGTTSSRFKEALCTLQIHALCWTATGSIQQPPLLLTNPSPFKIKRIKFAG